MEKDNKRNNDVEGYTFSDEEWDDIELDCQNVIAEFSDRFNLWIRNSMKKKKRNRFQCVVV